MPKLTIIANLGRVRVLTNRPTSDDPRDMPHLEERPELNADLATPSISDVVTDQAGRFSQSQRPGEAGGRSQGEEHHLQAELDRKALDRVASRIAEVVASENAASWRLVAPPTITPALLEALPAAVRKSLADTVAADLVKTPLADLEKRFL
jgi:hypothetical protein